MQQLPVTEKRLQDSGLHHFAALLIAALLLLTGCASRQDQTLVYQTLRRNNYDKALQILESNVADYYGQTDEVLYLLDSGVLAHYAGQYTSSNEKFSMAEKLIDEYYAVSVGQSVSSWFVNDLVKDYAGEEFEDIYGNIFMALNYVHMGMTEDAFVEIRRFDNKQRLLLSKYADALSYANTQLKDRHADIPPQSMQFSNSALARYLSMILYRSEGQVDNAAIDRRYIDQAFATQLELYPFPVPSSLDDELTVPKGMGRLNLMGFTGLSPAKLEKRVNYYDPDNNSYFTFAYPYMVKRPSYVREVRARITGSDGSEYTVPLEMIESIENIAMDTFSQKAALIYTKSLIRATTKALAGNAIRQGLDDDDGGILSILTMVVQEMSESADTRTTGYFPGCVYVSGITLIPDVYTVTIEYVDGRGNVISSDTHTDVAVREKGINLTESLCLQ